MTRITPHPLPGLLAVAAFLASGFAGHCEESGHQRMGVERDLDLEVSVESSSGISVDSYGAVTVYRLDTTNSVDLTVDRTWRFGVGLPLQVRMISGADWLPPVALGVGDLESCLSYSFRGGDARFSIRADVSLPTGAWQPGAESVGLPALGSGRIGLGLSASASLIADPVVLGASAAWRLGLPRADGLDGAWSPGSASLCVTVTELLNSVVGYTLGVSQRLSLPGIGVPGASASYDANGFIELFLAWMDVSVRVGLAGRLLVGGAPVSLSVTAGYAWRKERTS